MREFRSVRWLGLAVLVFGSGAAWAQPTVPVTVKVKDPSGALISQAAVAFSQSAKSPESNLQTDVHGRATARLTPGNYTLRVEALGFQGTHEVVSVAGAEILPVMLTVASAGPGVQILPTPAPDAEAVPVTAMIQSAPAPAAGYTPVTVVVTDASGAVVPGAEIRVTPGSPAGDRLITDEQGRAQLGMPAGHYQIEVTAQGFTPNKGALIVVDKPQTLTVTLTAVPSSGGVPVNGGPAPMQPGAVPLESTREMPRAEGASESAAASGNTLVIVGTGGLRGVFTLATLLQYPQTTVTIHDHHTNADETYSGVPLIDLLAKLGVPHGADLKGKALGTYVVATGSDGYKSVVALGELDPEFHPGVVLIADTMDGKPLDKAGPFRLVVTEDKRPARSVRNLVKVEVRTAE
jgi:hypothetical protein